MDTISIGKKIRIRRQELGLSQEELAKRLGFKSKTSITKIEMDINDIPQSKLGDFANALDTTIIYLLSIKEDTEIDLSTNNSISIGDIIRQKRLEQGLTLLQVADKLGVKEATVQRYESGEIKNIKHETVSKLANILHCSPSLLLGWTNNLKNDEKVLLETYNALSDRDKKVALNLLSALKNTI